MRLPVFYTPLRRRWPLPGLAALLVVALVALLLGPGAALGQSATPTVTDVAVTSNAGDDDTYILGDVIQITLTFSEAVRRHRLPTIEDRHGPGGLGREAGSLRGRQRHGQPHLHPHRGGAELLHPGHRRPGELPGIQRRKHQVGIVRHRRRTVPRRDGATTRSHKVDWRQSPPTTPTVTGVAVSSDAGDEDTYFLGDVIRITLIFSEPVNVTGAFHS